MTEAEIRELAAWVMGAGILLGLLFGRLRRSADVMVGSVAAAIWSGIAVLALWRFPKGVNADDRMAMIAVLLAVSFLPLFLWWAIGARKRREMRTLGAPADGEGEWSFLCGGVEVRLERVMGGHPVRFVDGTAHVLSARVPFFDGAVVSSRDPTGRRPWRYEGPPHIAAFWLGEEAASRLDELFRVRTVEVRDGFVWVCPRAWLDEATLARELGPIRAFVEAAEASGARTAARLLVEARAPGREASRRLAWRMLADHLPDRLTPLLPAAVGDADPLVRVIAARRLGDRAALAYVLAYTGDADALRAAARAVREEGWAELADAVAARIGVPAGQGGRALIAALGEVGGARHLRRLGELAEVGDEAIRREARDARARILARVGGEAAGRVAIGGGEGGEVGIAEGGGVAIVETTASLTTPTTR